MFPLAAAHCSAVPYSPATRFTIREREREGISGIHGWRGGGEVIGEKGGDKPSIPLVVKKFTAFVSRAALKDQAAICRALP